MIVGTAGHIDHGKTALVRALTGVDTDRLKEEKARGITIELGYAYQALEHGDVLGFIDVPGHERLIHTMLAGAAGIDFALLVVAADDGIMPQTREHLSILHLLGVGLGAVALTKIDRVESPRIAIVEQHVRALLAPTVLAEAPIFPVSAPSGTGIASLRAHLHTIARERPARAVAGEVRLAVDRSFSLKGTGTVVTGTLFSGCVEVGTDLMLSPRGLRVRLRGLHVQDRPATRGVAGQRCALNLAGIDKDAIQRGDWIVTPRLHHPVERFDARLRLTPDAPAALRHWSPVHIHLGAAHGMARVALLEGEQLQPGGNALVQLVLDRPLGALHGDPFIIRDGEARHTLGGGRVLDIFAPARKRKTPQRLHELATLEIEDPRERLARLVADAPWGLDLTRLGLAWNRRDLATLLPVDCQYLRRADEAYAVAGTVWQQLGNRLLEGLTDYHAHNAEELGPDAARARRMWLGKLPPTVFNTLVADAISRGVLRRTGAWLHRPEHTLQLNAKDTALAERVLPLLETRPLDPPWTRDIARALDLDETAVRKLLLKLSGQGLTYQVVHDLFYAPKAIEQLARVVCELELEHGEVRAAMFRDRIGIGRKRSIQLLEFFDRVGLTRRVRDTHRVRGDSALANANGNASVH